MNARTFLGLVTLLLAAAASQAQHIYIRVSVKVITDPVTGARPSGITDDLFSAAMASANQWMDSFGRGYRFNVTEILNIGGPTQGGASGPSQWYGQDVRGTPEPWQTFQNDINTDPRYLRRTDQVNFYITSGPSSNPGGACPIPPGEVNLIACMGYVDDGPWWMNHELGHFFGLSHTFGGCGCPDCSYPNSGDDGIADTLPESSCDTQDQIALRSFGLLYASLATTQQRQVDDTFFNIMSYHNATTKNQVENVMTELQLDLHADTANSYRRAFVTGTTVFVSPFGFDLFPGTASGLPKRTVASALTVASAAGTDIVLLRPGSYPESLTISQPVTLRATREGPATIGK